MDSRDRQILNYLKENSRMKYVDIAKKMGISEGCVRQRVSRMVNEGTISRFTIECSGNEMEAIVLIKTKTGATKSVVEMAKKTSQKIFELSGEYDVAVNITAASTDELNEKIDTIRKITGVTHTNTLIKLISH